MKRIIAISLATPFFALAASQQKYPSQSQEESPVSVNANEVRVGNSTFSVVRSPATGIIIGMRDSGGASIALASTPKGAFALPPASRRPDLKAKGELTERPEVEEPPEPTGSYISEISQLAGVEINGFSTPDSSYWSGTLLPMYIGASGEYLPGTSGSIPIPDPGPDKAERCRADTNACLLQAGDIAALAMAACIPIAQEMSQKAKNWGTRALAAAAIACVKGAEALRDNARTTCHLNHVACMTGG